MWYTIPEVCVPFPSPFTSERANFENRNLDAVKIILGTAQVSHQPPKNHPEAKATFQEVLQRRPDLEEALIGLGMIYQHDEQYSDALGTFDRVLQMHPDNIRIKAERAWCKELMGHHTEALSPLEECLSLASSDNPKGRAFRALLHYRIGICKWELDSSRQARKDRSRAYAHFLASIKSDLSFAPAYTSLGLFYEDYARDMKRARQCFQKAFELSVSEVTSAERLARSFADFGEWDIVEAIAQRLVENGITQPTPGSKRKGLSWPHAAMGIAQINKQEYVKSTTSFLAAIRICPEDYNSYVGLGESYYQSGRYNSAARALSFAESPPDGMEMERAGKTWFTKYLLSNVHRELGAYDEAISGYDSVIRQDSNEEGVRMTLIETLVERAWYCLQLGLYSEALKTTSTAIHAAGKLASVNDKLFNLWKAVGAACSLFTWVSSKVEEFPLSQVKGLLMNNFDVTKYRFFAEHDGVDATSLEQYGSEAEEINVSACTRASILAYKRALFAGSDDKHVQSISWYNLGWAEYRAHTALRMNGELASPDIRRFLLAATRCFKQAIELEAGNADFWNALGVATIELNAKVAQHAFVRSLHINERKAAVWVNMGTLSVREGDYELAHQAFARAQATEPDYAHAWIGEGIVALMYGDRAEAGLHFTHAFEISNSSLVIAKRQYAVSAFEHLVKLTGASPDLLKAMRPLFAIRQLRFQTTKQASVNHLAALFHERLGEHDAAVEILQDICRELEAEYEATETDASLNRFIEAKVDLARNRLGLKDYSAAADDAQTVLDLTSDGESSTLSEEDRQRCRLSAHLTAGLANYLIGAVREALSLFRTTLKENDSMPNVVLLLARVLWAGGTDREKQGAKEQLWHCLEINAGHVGCITLLGTMAALEGDRETMDAIREEIYIIRTQSNLNNHDSLQLQRLLGAFILFSRENAQQTDIELTNELCTSIMLSPWQPHGWAQFATVVSDLYPSEMALQTTIRIIPPHGGSTAKDLVKALSSTGRLRDAQTAVMLSPSMTDGWQSLRDAVAVL